MAQNCDCVGVVGLVNVVEWLSSDETILLPIMVIFGEPVISTQTGTSPCYAGGAWDCYSANFEPPP